MTPWRRQLLVRLAFAVTPLWLDPLAWRLVFSPISAISSVGEFLAAFELGYALFFLAALVGLAISPFVLLVRTDKANVASWMLCAGVFIAAFVGGLTWRMEIRSSNIARVTERGQPLVTAISAYQKDHGKPPAALEELVPKYIDHIPETGIGIWPKFYYQTGEPDRRHGNEWELVVTPPNLPMGFDSMHYYPRQNYSDAGFAPIENNWGYFHD